MSGHVVGRVRINQPVRRACQPIDLGQKGVRSCRGPGTTTGLGPLSLAASRTYAAYASALRHLTAIVLSSKES